MRILKILERPDHNLLEVSLKRPPAHSLALAVDEHRTVGCASSYGLPQNGSRRLARLTRTALGLDDNRHVLVEAAGAAQQPLK